MIKLKDLLVEVKFTKPNFDYEWEEAKRYPKLFPNKQTWDNKVKTGKVMNLDCSMNIQNTDMCEPDVDLEPEKVNRVRKMLDSGELELPIVMKHKGKYELIGGNTRLVALKKAGVSTKAWVFNYD